MPEKALSILIPAYNAEHFITRCLDSLVSSLYLDKLDILIINDGSKDKTSDICKEYQTRYPESIRLIDKENGNVGSVYNVGFKECIGKYTKELDADDWINTECLDKLVELLEKTECDLVLNSFNTVDDTGTNISISYPCKDSFKRYNENLLLCEYGDMIVPAMHAYTYKTEVLKTIPKEFDEKCYHVDLEYTTFPMVNCKTFIVFDFPVYNYLLGRDEQSMSARSLIKNIDQHITIFISCINYYENYLIIIPKVDKQIFDRMCGVLATLFIICYSMPDKSDSKNKIHSIIKKMKTNSAIFFNKIKNYKQEKLIYLTIILDQMNYSFYNIIKTLLKIKGKLYK